MCKWCHSGGGVWGSSPTKIFGLNGVKSCNVRQNKPGNGTFIKARYSVYDGRRDNPWNLEVIRIFQIFYTMYNTGEWNEPEFFFIKIR